MKSKHGKTLLSYSEGRKNRGKVKNVQNTWDDFCDKLKKPFRTDEKRAAFLKLSQDEKNDLKKAGGYIIGAPMRDGVRRRPNVQPRVLLSIDNDKPRKDIQAQLELGFTSFDKYEFVAHTTRSSSHKAPRIRVFMMANRLVTPEEYGPVIRILSSEYEGWSSEIEEIDHVSFRPMQIMYKPTASKDQDYWFHRNYGELVDVDALLARYTEVTGNDPFDLKTLPRSPREEELRESAKKAENPLEKDGLVGTFCRWIETVDRAIEEFELPYTLSDEGAGGKRRYTYTEGSGADGAEVEDDGLFLYSHHGTDPVSERLVNAWDLVRIHKFEHLDANALPDTPLMQLPSSKAMKELAMSIKGFRDFQLSEKYTVSTELFGDVDADDEEDAPAIEQDDEPEEDVLGFDDEPAADPDDPLSAFDTDPDARLARDRSEGAGSPGSNASPAPAATAKPGKKPKAPPVDTWFPAQLELDQNNNIKAIPSNAATILYNDARTHGAIAFNDFTRQIVLRYDFRSNIPQIKSRKVRDRVNGDRWQDVDDITFRIMLGVANDPGNGFYGYGVQVTDRDMNAAVVTTAHRNSFHPIRDYLHGLKWDGVKRIDRLFVDYLGCPDTPYHRETSHLKLVASVTRVEEPGHKFDNAAIIEGDQGIRKSSFVKALYSESWFGELNCDLGNPQQVAETIGGIWGSELPEMTSFHKSDFNDAKAFMRRTKDRVRMAYDRRVTEFDRQLIIWGTTNDRKYLKDPTGNRSYWPIRADMTQAKKFAVVAGQRQIDTDEIERLRDQLWAEAYAVYTEMRKAQPRGELKLVLSAEAIKEAERLQNDARVADLHETWAEVIQDWLDTPIPLSQYLAEAGFPAEAFSGDADDADAHQGELVLRCAVTRDMILAGALHKDRGIQDYQTNTNFGKTMPMIVGWDRALREKTDGQKGGALSYVQGIRKRWIFRDDISAEERKLGYRVVPPDDEITENDEIDLV